ncbi:hypothetical protein LTR66_001005 [Elasticomyces elasticus]|nr:hypothetical protein LTR50_005230 [Elasticomyces elasticus]KAK5000058.1 hypothetical protein LTR66_001005 [Elasticomyces elasticus]KAK5004934.1 hypothetical protein LTR28_008308 [Elasticomyces elasticus]
MAKEEERKDGVPVSDVEENIDKSIPGYGHGLLGPILDPLGKGLQKGLSPVGSVVGGMTQPINPGKKDDEKEKPMGGKEQTGDNPLGL